MLKVIILLGLLLTCAGCLSPAETPPPSPSLTVHTQSMPTEDAYTQPRQAMVREQIELRGVGQASVLDAMRRVERHRFVPEEYLDQAYDDHPLPIGYGQTISQPYIVALMSEALGVEAGDRVLEIGTGSGYQAAVLAEMGVEVYTVEIVPELASLAVQHLEELGYDNVQVLAADGYYGWEEHAPYDAIIVTAAPDHLPQPLANQLAEGGRLVIPIGPVGMVQTLWQFEKAGGELEATNLGDVRFVPFTRDSSEGN
jgi:protein-L-isoaspartate(D-aspartate) O-methyltransferase